MAEQQIESVYTYIHKNPYIKTVYDLIQSPESLVYQWKPRELLGYEYEGITNIELIWNNYDSDLKTPELTAIYEKDLINAKNPDYNGGFTIIYLFKFTKLYFPSSKWNRDILHSEGNIVQTEDYEVFLMEKLKELCNDKKFIPISELNIGDNLTKLISACPTQTVYMWCKGYEQSNKMHDETVSENQEETLTSDNNSIDIGEVIISADSSTNIRGKFINLSKYINSITTVSGMEGNSFQISLPPIKGIYVANEGWKIDDEEIVFDNNRLFLNNNYDKNNKERDLFFKKIISQNDIIWIRFEALVSELPNIVRQNFEDIDAISVPSIDGNKRIYDFIGLVDNVQEITSYNGEITTQLVVSGRDVITKNLIEDGCFFYPEQYIEGESIVGNHTNSQDLKRYFGVIQNLIQYSQKSIEYCIQFVLNSLTNIEIAPDSVFQFYKDKTERFLLSDVGESEVLNTLSDLENNTINSILNCRSLEKVSLENFQDELFKSDEIFNTFLNILLKANEEGKLSFVDGIFSFNNFNNDGEILNNTKIPNSIISQLFSDPNNMFNNSYANIIISEISDYVKLKLNSSNSISTKFDYSYGNALGIWQIVKVILDDNIRNKKIIDSSIGNETGSLINYFKKICQQPFVEFFTDVYEDKPYLVVRKPPFDKKSILEYVDSFINTTTGINVIKSQDVIQKALTYNNISYSWYRIIPQGNLPTGNNVTFSFIKALHFPEYAKVFGEKPLEITSNYLTIDNSFKDRSWFNTILNQLVEEMKYLVETNSYLPFTREGTITLEGGDRRIKKGIWILYEQTNEIYYVNEVTNMWSVGDDGKIQRNTILNVSRGMYLPYVRGQEVIINNKSVNISYFDIINGINEDLQLEFEEVNYTKEVQYIEPIVDLDKPNELKNQNLKEDEITIVQQDIYLEKKIVPRSIEVFFEKMEKEVPQNKYYVNILRTFVWRVKNELGYDCAMPSAGGWRSRQQQRNLARRNKKAAKTLSQHELSKAIDANFTKRGRPSLRMATSKRVWKNSGIPDLAKSMGLRWGGDFSEYDPVHFDALNIKNNPSQKEISGATQGYTQKPSTKLTNSEELQNFEELFLNAISNEEGGKLGQKTKLKSSALGNYQITQGTRRLIYKQMGYSTKEYSSLDAKFKSDPTFEREIARRLRRSLAGSVPSKIRGWERERMLAKGWYTGDVNYRDDKIPSPSSGNKLTAGRYADNVIKKMRAGYKEAPQDYDRTLENKELKNLQSKDKNPNEVVIRKENVITETKEIKEKMLKINDMLKKMTVNKKVFNYFLTKRME